MRERADRRDAIFDVIRRALRARGMTYRELGRHLGLSESGVKKVFASRDCNLDRLLAIAEVLEIEASELLSEAERPRANRVELGESAQRWLLDHPEHFAWFWWLTTTREHPRVIREREGLSIAQMRASLDALEARGLVSLGLDDRVELPAMIRWEDGGPLIDALHRRWSRTTIEQARHDGYVRLQQLDLPLEAREEFASALDALADEFMRRARSARATRPDHEPVRVVLAMAPGTFDPRQTD